MADLLKLYVDLQRRRFVTSTTDRSLFQMPKLWQGDTISLRVYLLDRAVPYSINTPYSLVDISSIALRVGIDAQPTGDTTGSPAAYQNSWSKDTAENYFYGTISLNTSAIDTLLGSAATVAAEMELEITQDGSNYETVAAEPVTIKAEMIESGATQSPPNDVAMGVEQALATFVQREGGAGETIILKSANGTWGRILGVNDDGTARDDILTV